jgi:polyvinyl alcohol dehydrogenase (cytochrome)
VAATAWTVALLAFPGSAVADWPTYGHDLSNTRDAGVDGPPAQDLPSLAQAWKFDSPSGDFTGTPVVAGGVLVAGDQGGVVHAIDAVSGRELWSRNLGAPINGTAAIDLRAPGGAAAFVPVAELGGPRLVRLSLADGAKQWDTVLIKHDGADVYGSPVFWRGAVYVGTSGPNNDDTTARGSVVALDERTGATRWQTFTVPPGSDGAAVWSTPAIDTATGRLYVGTGNNYHQPTTDTEDAMLALDATTGAIVGKHQATAGDSFSTDNATGGPDYDFGASVNLFNGPHGELLAGEGQKSGTYWAVDRATMQPVWHTVAGPGGYLGGILGSTAYDGARIYGGDSFDGRVFALGLDGSVTWNQFETSGTHFGPVMVAHGVVYSMDPAGFLTARDPATGSVVTKLPLGAPAFGGASAAGRALYASVGTGPPPAPAPQNDGSGSIVAFGDTSRSGARRLGLTVSPRRVRARRRVTLHFYSQPGVTIRLAGRVVRTGARGRARVRLRFGRRGLKIARATAPGWLPGHATVRVLRR